MEKVALLLLAAAGVTIGREQTFPVANGTTWTYQLTEEAGEELAFAPGIAGADGKIHRTAIYRIDGTQNVGGKELLKFEMHRDGVITNTDLLTVDNRGIFCAARIDQYGQLTALEPPQTIVATPLRIGATWDYVGKMGDVDVRQHWRVVAEEDVDLAAGKFHAFHIQCEQAVPNTTRIDRWFVNGVGIVKDITDARASDGDLLRRITLELKERPKLSPRPEVKPVPPPRKVSVTVSTSSSTAPAHQISRATGSIYARWQGHDLHVGAKIRALWVAENVAGVAPPEQTIDEASTVANSGSAHGIFTLSRPEEGWAPGNYRVDVYVDAELADSARVKIAE